MNKVKTFNTTEMSEDMFEYLVESGIIYEDGVSSYSVGAYVDEYEHSDSKWLYPEIAVENAKEVDKFLISKGAQFGEIVFIFHGAYNQFWK